MSFGEDRGLAAKHKFVVSSARLGFAAFQKCSELSFEVAQIDYYEGGALIPMKTPGRLTYSDVTLERGTSNFFDFHDWALEVGDASRDFGGAGEITPEYKTDDFSIVQRDLDNSVKRSWNLIGVWPKKYVAGDWDNTVDEVVIEQLVLTYDYFESGPETDTVLSLGG